MVTMLEKIVILLTEQRLTLCYGGLLLIMDMRRLKAV